MTTTLEPLTDDELRAQEREGGREALSMIRTGLRDYAYWTWGDTKLIGYLQRLWRRIVGD